MFPSFLARGAMTAAEQATLVQSTRDAPRDHGLYSMALGTGLRLREPLALSVGEVSPDGREVRWRVPPDPATTKGGR
jgi:integrase